MKLSGKLCQWLIDDEDCFSYLLKGQLYRSGLAKFKLHVNVAVRYVDSYEDFLVVDQDLYERFVLVLTEPELLLQVPGDKLVKACQVLFCEQQIYVYVEHLKVVA